MTTMSFLAAGTGLRETVARFPVLVIFSALLCLHLITDNHEISLFGGDAGESLSCILIAGYFWCGIVVLVAESLKLRTVMKALLMIAGVTVLSVLLATENDFLRYTRMVFIMPSLLLGLMVAPYLKQKSNEAFWSYNYALWSGAFIAFVASFVLCLGLFACLQSIRFLFDVKLWNDKSYFDMWLVCATLVAPIYALFWVPRDFGHVQTDYSKAYSILVNWILAPLSLAYFLILYAYYARIALQGHLPDGNLAMITAGFGGFGIALYISAWPMRKTGTALLQFMHKWFFVLLALPLVMMAAAIFTRIADYGVTEQRYFVVLALLWMAAMTLAFGLRGDRLPIRIMPLSLAVLLLAGSFGPWGAMSVSAQSQMKRLNSLVEKYKLAENGHIVRQDKPLASFDDQKNLSSILEYFWDTDRKAYLPDYLQGYPYAPKVMEAMGLEFVSGYEKSFSDDKVFTLNMPEGENGSIDISGFDALYPYMGFDSLGPSGSHKVYPAKGRMPEITIDLKDGVLTIEADGSKSHADLVALIRKNRQGGQGRRLEKFLPGSDVLDLKAGQFKIRLLIQSLNGQYKGEKVEINYMTFRMLVAK